MEEVKWVWFDLDDTLFDFHKASREALRRLYFEEGLDRFYPSVDAWLEAYLRVNHQLWELYNRGGITQDRLCIDRFLIPLAESGKASVEEIETLSRRFDPLYLEMLSNQKALLPDAIEVLKATRKAGYKTGILSNGFTHAQHTKIEYNGLKELIDEIVLSDDIGINKPDSRLFEYAMERTGDTSPGHHLMIGDNPATDIAGALGAGWYAIWLCSSQADDSETVPETAKITGLKEALPIIGAVFQP